MIPAALPVSISETLSGKSAVPEIVIRRPEPVPWSIVAVDVPKTLSAAFAPQGARPNGYIDPTKERNGKSHFAN